MNLEYNRVANFTLLFAFDDISNFTPPLSLVLVGDVANMQFRLPAPLNNAGRLPGCFSLDPLVRWWGIAFSKAFKIDWRKQCGCFYPFSAYANDFWTI